MGLTREQHDDLKARLDALLSEYAAASQRSEAVAKGRALIDAKVPVDEAPAAVSAAEPVEEHHDE